LAKVSAGQNVLLVGHGFVAKVIRALIRQDFSDFFDWQLGNGHWLVLEAVERIIEAELPTRSPFLR
jgi:probable phosphoglycerate mutase